MARLPPEFWLLVGAMASLYVAGRVAFDTVARSPAASVGRLAVAQWMPIALVVVVATLMRRPEVAVGVIFATSVAALSLVFGLTVFVSRTDFEAAPGRRAWPFVLAAAVLVLLAGFRSEFTWLHAVVLFAEGLVVLPLWRDAEVPPVPSEPRGASVSAGLAIVLTVLLALIGAWAATTGTAVASQNVRLLPANLIVTVMLGPALVLPIIGSGAIMAERGQTPTLLATLVAIVLLNLLVLLPLTIAIWYATPAVGQYASLLNPTPTTQPTTMSAVSQEEAEESPPPLPFPVSTWRVDTVVLIVLGFMLLPLSTGRWQIGRAEGAVLILIYMAYLVTTTRLGARLW